MIIHKFNTQTERQEFGGSAFIEIAYCKLKPETKINKILNLTKLPIKSNDSLYIHLNYGRHHKLPLKHHFLFQ